MRWLFQRILDRLTAQFALLVAAQLESQAEMELSETRADMLRRAQQLERDETPGADVVASQLRTAAEQLGGDERGPAEGVLGALRRLQGENLREPENLRLAFHEKGEKKPLELEAPEKRGRSNKRS